MEFNDRDQARRDHHELRPYSQTPDRRAEQKLTLYATVQEIRPTTAAAAATRSAETS